MESSPSAFVESLRPAGSKRSGKRDLIVNVFLRQEGHLTADNLVDLIRREDQRISRATIYRTLQWMVDAGIARKVDFGEGRFRFEHSYRHPRHFHLICKSLQPQLRVPQLRHRGARRGSGVGAQLHAAPERAADPRRPARPAGRDGPPPRRAARPSCCSRATRCGSRLPPSAAASSSTRARRASRATRAGRRVFKKLAEEEKEHLCDARGRYRELLQQDPQLESRPDVPLLQGRGERPVRRRRRSAHEGRERSPGPDDRHPLRARLAQVLQAVRRAIRGLRRQAHLPRVRGRGTDPSRSPDP